MLNTAIEDNPYEIKPIPTEYNHQKFKSRLEATLAYILDTLYPERWSYEPQSFLLPNGVFYQPDFYISDIKSYIETRGSSYSKGNSQIEQFPAFLQNDEEYLVFGPTDIGIWSKKRNYTGIHTIYLCNCPNCWEWVFLSEQGSYACPNCHFHDGDTILREGGIIYYRKGKIMIDLYKHLPEMDILQWAHYLRENLLNGDSNDDE